MKQPRIITAAFGHETNGISTLVTGLTEFEDYLLALGTDIPKRLKESGHEMAGVMQAADDYGWDLSFSIAAWASPSGPITNKAWGYITKRIVQDCCSTLQCPVDGVLLCLHGAMASIEFSDGEGELLRLVRLAVGDNVPIAITLDLHANVTPQMARYANIISAYRTYPHIDQAQTARRAAKLLQRAIKTRKMPHTLMARRDISTALDDGRTTTDNPMTQLLSLADSIENEQEDIATISLYAGFDLAVLPKAGPSVCVTYWQDEAAARMLAENLMDKVYASKDFDSNIYLSVTQAIKQVRHILAKQGSGPIILADYSDNPGAGGYGDSTFLLQGMIEANVNDAVFGTICDPKVAKQLCDAKMDSQICVTLGGKIDPLWGAPLILTGRIVAQSNGTFVAQGPRHRGATQRLGPTAVLRVGGVDVVIASLRLQCTELEVFTHIGIDPAQKKVVAVKSMHHFRAAFEPIARAVLVVDSGAMVGLLAAPHYEHMRNRSLQDQ